MHATAMCFICVFAVEYAINWLFLVLSRHCKVAVARISHAEAK